MQAPEASTLVRMQPPHRFLNRIRFAGSFLLVFLLASCDRSIVNRPDTPPDQILLYIDASIPQPQVQSLTQALGAPVRYLGRLETPFRVTPLALVDASLLRGAATLVAVFAHEPGVAQNAALTSLPQTALIEQYSRGEDDSLRTWSLYENAYLLQQTLITAQISTAATVDAAAACGRDLRDSLERSQVRHRRQRLRAAPGAAALPRKTTRGLFEVLVPEGYAWSDTSSGWPQSVQIAIARPTRVVTVFWLEDASADWLQSRPFLVGMLRDAMWRLQRDRLEEDSVEWLPGVDGSLEMRAIWQNPDRIAGGPLHSRFVYDASRQRLYGVQSLVFLPGADKHRAMREALAIASTFSIVEPY